MAQARGAVASGRRRREVAARLREMPWAALIVLILVLIVLLAMWGKWPRAVHRTPQAPTGTVIGLHMAWPSGLPSVFNRRSLQA